MHDTAEAIGGAFLEIYSRPGHVIVEVGSLDINGSVRNYAHPDAKYVGIDMHAGPGVDIVAKDEFVVPIASGLADVVVATSIFEHAAFFWVTMLELLRITKTGGVIYISAPSNGFYHRYPMDNWRFYPDAGKMLERWGRHNGYALHLIESFIAERRDDIWNDFVAVFQVGPPPTSPQFLCDHFAGSNVWKLDADAPMRVRAETEDMVRLKLALMREHGLRQELQTLRRQFSELRLEIGELRKRVRSGTPQSTEAPAATIGEVKEKSPEVLEQERFIAFLEREMADTTAARAHLRTLQGLPLLPKGESQSQLMEVQSGFGPY